jgi:hypothetical protein
MMAEKHPKRPRDLNQWAKRMVDIATGGVNETELLSAKQERGRKGGSKGGPARARTLTPQQRSEIAQAAANARWKKG